MTIEGVDITPGSGKTVAVDTINVGGGNKEFQLLKLALGAEDAFDLLVDSGQQVMANSIPVVQASDAPPKLVRLVVNPTNKTTAYAAGTNIGGKLTMTNAARISGGSGFIKSLHLIERAQQKPSLLFHVFESNPTVATITDGSAITFSTDISKVIRSFFVPGTIWQNDTGFAFADIDVDLPFVASGSADLYLAVDTPNTPLWGVANALIFDFMIDQR